MVLFFVSYVIISHFIVSDGIKFCQPYSEIDPDLEGGRMEGSQTSFAIMRKYSVVHSSLLNDTFKYLGMFTIELHLPIPNKRHFVKIEMMQFVFTELQRILRPT